MSLKKAEQKAEASEGDKRLFEEKEFFSVLNRGIVNNDDPDNPYLLYYKSDSVNSQSSIPLNAIKTATSQNDDHLKSQFIKRPIYRFTISGIIGLILSSAPLFISNLEFFEFLNSLLAAESRIIMYFIYGLLAMLLIIFFEVLFFISVTKFEKDVEINFNTMSKTWETSISDFLGIDIHTKIFGIRNCLLVFRQFIKWRRFASIYASVSNFVFIFMSATFGLTISAIFVFCWRGIINESNMLVVSIFFGFMMIYVVSAPAISVFRLREYLRNVTAERTMYRDPTVQIAVMISELHQRFVEKKMA